MMEPRNEEINAKKILAVEDATYSVAKRKPEKIQACQNLNSDLYDTGTAL